MTVEWVEGYLLKIMFVEQVCKLASLGWKALSDKNNNQLIEMSLHRCLKHGASWMWTDNFLNSSIGQQQKGQL